VSIFDRLTRLIRANVNELIDRAEDPEKMLDQILRDMRANIDEARTTTVSMIAQEKELAGEIEQTRRLAEEWGRKALAAVNADKEDLAREALRRKRDNEANSELYAQQHAVQMQAVTKLKDQLRQLEAKYQATLGQRDVMIVRQRRAKAQEQVAATLSVYTPYDPSEELDRMERKIRGTEARAAALTETAAESWDAQFRVLEDPAIEAELQALKTHGAAALSAGGSTTPRPTAQDFQDLEEFDIDQELQALKGESAPSAD
jgi:phage shock protein A